MNIFKIGCRIIKRKVSYFIMRILWKKKNAHNFTNMCNDFDMSYVNVGKGTYGGIFVINVHKSKKVKLEIGNYCSIANNVTFILAGEHNMQTISTYPFESRIINQKNDEALSKGNIIVNDDVWIGYNSTILSGVTIGQGAVIAAHSLVNKDVPPYAIVAGVPAKIIRFRFTEDIISKLLCIDYTKLTREKIINNYEVLYQKITNENIDEIIKSLEISKRI